MTPQRPMDWLDRAIAREFHRLRLTLTTKPIICEGCGKTSSEVRLGGCGKPGCKFEKAR